MKTKELSGAALDWAVAEAEGVTCAIWQGVVVDEFSNPLMYHDDWALAGAIIEREKMGLHYGDGTWGVDAGRWEANHPNCLYVEGGATPLEAAMRCYVASCLGNEVQLPEELK
jgi:hypothetical protein